MLFPFLYTLYFKQMLNNLTKKLILANYLLISIIFFSCEKKTYYFNVKKVTTNKATKNNLLLISDKGSSRATAYGNVSKIDFSKNLAFISWLAIKDGKFKPVVSVYSIKKKTLLHNYFFDESYDNHGVPSIVIDNNGKIHLFYYPHISHAIKYWKGDININGEIKWTKQPIITPETYTYPSAYFNKNYGVIVGARNTPTIKGPDPLSYYSLTTIKKNNYTSTNILGSSYHGYTAFSPRLNLTDSSIQLFSRFHENSSSDFYGGNQSLIYIENTKGSNIWTDMYNDTLSYNDYNLYNWSFFRFNNLINSRTTKKIESGGTKEDGSNLYILGITNDSLNNPNLYYIKEQKNRSKLYQAKRIRNLKNIEWKKKEITFLNSYDSLKRFTAPTGNATSLNDTEYFTATIQNENLKRKKYNICLWGEKSNSVILFYKIKNRYKIIKEFLSTKEPIWFPQVKLHKDNLFLIFTKGANEKRDNSQKNKTEVYLFHSKIDKLHSQENIIKHQIETILQ